MGNIAKTVKTPTLITVKMVLFVIKRLETVLMDNMMSAFRGQSVTKLSIKLNLVTSTNGVLFAGPFVYLFALLFVFLFSRIPKILLVGSS